MAARIGPRDAPRPMSTSKLWNGIKSAQFPHLLMGNDVVAEPARANKTARSLASLEAEMNQVSNRIVSLNREMIHLSSSKRRERWQDYYRDLGWLMRRREELSKAIAAFE